MKKRLSEDDAAIWKRITRTINPLHPVPKQSDDDHFGNDSNNGAKPKRFVGNNAGAVTKSIPLKSIPKRNLEPRLVTSSDRKVRRGSIDVSNSIDLHGLTSEAARAALARFIAGRRHAGVRTLLVITGKGGGVGRGVIRAAFPDWISSPPLSEAVWGFAQAHQKHGGAGAFYVFLRKAEEKG